MTFVNVMVEVVSVKGDQIKSSAGFSCVQFVRAGDEASGTATDMFQKIARKMVLREIKRNSIRQGRGKAVVS